MPSSRSQPTPNPSTDAVPVEVRVLPHGEGLSLPAYATTGAAGMDVLSAEDIDLAPAARHAVATGLALAIPPGFEIQVRPRSGLAQTRKGRPDHEASLRSARLVAYAHLTAPDSHATRLLA